MDVETFWADARARMDAYRQSREAQQSLERMASGMANIVFRHAPHITAPAWPDLFLSLPFLLRVLGWRALRRRAASNKNGVARAQTHTPAHNKIGAAQETYPGIFLGRGAAQRTSA